MIPAAIPLPFPSPKLIAVNDASGAFRDGTKIAANPPYTFNFWFEAVPTSTSGTDFHSVVATGNAGSTDKKVKIIVK